MFRLRSHSAPTNRRPIAILLLLMVCLLAIALLGWQAFQTQRSNAAVAANVIRDYATLAAEEFERRFAASVDSYGHQLLIVTTQHATTAEAMRAAVTPPAPDHVLFAAELSAAFFVIEAGRLHVSGTPLSEELAATLAELARQAPAAAIPYRLERVAATGEQVICFFHVDSDGRQRLLGYLLDPSGFGEFAQRTLEGRPLLPGSLARGVVNNNMLFVEIRDAEDRVVFRRNSRYENQLAATRVFATEREAGILAGYSVRVSIDPYGASKLIIGGLPESRLPALFIVFNIAVLLMAVAIWLYVREVAVMKMREEFVSQVSHELRTPLTQIRMFAETLLLNRTRGAAETKRSLTIIDREARRLSRLVENVLRSSKVSDELHLDCEETLLGPELKDVCETAESISDSQSIQLMIRGNPAASINRTALRQVVLNVLENAAKYGPDDQTIRVHAESAPGAARISIEDDGPGIPEHEQERVWGKFYRLGRDRDSAIGGTGIGLSVVRSLVTAMHGRCWIETPDSGRGTRVVIELPDGGAND